MPRIGSFVQGLYRDESSTISEITAALCKAQPEYLPIELDETGFRNGRAYKYGSIHSCRRSTLAANSKHGLVLTHVYGETDKGEFVTTVLRHTSGEYIASTSPVPAFDDVQDRKAAKTLLCRTHIEGLLGIITERDADGAIAPNDASMRANWRTNLSLAVTAISAAASESDLDRYRKVAMKRIEEGAMSPDAMPEITKACEARVSQLRKERE